MNLPDTDAAAFSRTTPKPWGSEVLFSPPGAPYVGKILNISAGHRLSLQWHDEKDESITLISGDATLALEGEDGALQEIQMALLTGYRVLPGRIHRLIATTDSVLVEASTPETGSTFRVEDDYGRSDEHLEASPASS